VNCGCHSHNGFQLRPSRSLEGLAQREGYRSTGLTDRDFFAILDTGVSVSASIEPKEPIFVDEITDQQYRRFHNGS